MDKLLHLTVSFMLTVCLNTKMPPKTASGAVFLIGVCKETWDYLNPPHRAEFGDILANAAGIILANKALEGVKCQERALNTAQIVATE